MAKLDELWDPVPRRLIADMRSEKWTTQRPAPDVVGWLWAFRQIGDGAVPSIRDLCAYAGWGSHRATRLLNEVVRASNAWTGATVERQAPHNGKKRNTSATPAQHLRNTSATHPQHLDTAVVDIVDEERNTSATPAQHQRNTSATPPQRRARSLFRKESDTTEQEEESGPPDVVPSPPPAEPSGSSERWTQAAEIIEADPEAWRASEEFQPSSDAYTFDDADPIGVVEQPSDPRPIESPISAVETTAKATPDVALTSPAQPSDPLEGFTPSPPPSASPAARLRGSSGEGVPGPTSAPQSAPSLFGRTDTAPEAQTPAKAPPRARKATAADKAADALAVYGAWRVYHPRAAETPTPGTLRALGSLLTEAGSCEDALLLIEWAHVGTCERARQIQGVAPWPDRRLKALWDLESLSRHVAGRIEMARSWKESATDKDSGLNVINLPPPSYRGPPNRTTRDIDFYKALELI